MSHERLAVTAADLEDLDLAALDAFLLRRAPGLYAATSREEAGVRLGLLGRLAPRVVASYVGLYVFGRVPQYVFPEWGVGCVSIDGRSLTDPVRDRSDLEGPLGSLLEQSLAFVRAQAGGAGEEYAETAVREAVVNALVHRDLKRPSRVAIRVFVDRLEIWSPGGPPDGAADLEELSREGGVSVPRNPLLAAVARELGMGEQIGRGLAVVARTTSSPADGRVELRTSPRDVLVMMPSRWQRPRAAQELS
jgi:predicted HTH transcriptional regulator